MPTISKWLIALVLFFSISAQATQLTEAQKLSDFDQTVSMIQSGYGPLQFKNSSIAINTTSLISQYRERVKATKTNQDFYYLIVQFIAEFKDSHFSARLPTTHKASLPFAVDLVDGKVLVDAIDRTQLSEQDFPFQKGDQVLEVNGEAVEKVVERLARNRGMGFEQTTRRMATLALTARNGRAFEVPTGEVTFKLRRGVSDLVEEAKLSWKVEGEAIDNFLRKRRDFAELSIASERRHERSFHCSGGTRTAIPKDATIIMNTPDAPFVAYYHPTPKGNVGYLRIPHYSPENGAFEERFLQYKYAVSVLEKSTVGLIIDQDHNCGGSVGYLQNMLGLFIPDKFKPIQFKLLATKQEYLALQEWLTEAPKYSIEQEGVKEVIEIVKKSWLAGEVMTPMVALGGGEYLYANPVRYTKPIIVLIDEMSGSGGDAFPAMMQGNGRAKLLGTRTMGAGGHVEEQPALYYSQIQFNMTKSLFFRPDGVPVENNGAVPDISYMITRDDFMYEYRGYQKFYVGKLLELVK